MTYYLVGLIPVGSTVRDDYPLVQARCHYKVLDVYTIAEVVQDYYSSAPVNRDVEYVFPLPPSAAVCAFKAVIDDDKVIKGIVKEKGEAKREYKEAVAQGKTAGLLQQEHADVFRVSLGNIKPKQKISIHISFVSIVSHDGNSPQSLRITMPTAIAPRYGTAPTNIPWFGKHGSNRFELTVAVQMSKPVTSVSSPSHPIGLTLGCAEKELQGDYEPSKAFVHLGDSAFLDKDIVIVISAQGLDVPRCCVERWLATEGAEETTDAYALTLVPKFDLPALPSQEYVFLVDRSGSMQGGRMEAVKTGLQIMLRSLPSRNTTFNIVSFGSRYTSLWPKSQIYSAETVAEASKHVDTFTANYGGTELRSALQFAFSSRLALTPHATEKTPTSVFVLTDGEAWDLDGIINLTTENVQSAKRQDSLLRTFVLGVGNQVSTAMCEGIARAGKGTTVYVAEGEKPDAKLMSLLKAARGGIIENLSVDWGVSESISEPDEDFEMVSGPTETKSAPTQLPPLSLFDEGPSSTEAAEVGPQKLIVQLPPTPFIQQAPKSDKLPIPLYPGFRCSIFAIIKQSPNPGPHSPSIKITGKVMGRDVAFQIPVTPIAIDSNVTTNAIDSGKLLHTLGAKALIQTYEDMPTTPETRAQIERLGKRYSLASSVTSFLAIDHESVTEINVTPVVLPQSELFVQGYGMAAPSPANLPLYGAAPMPRQQYYGAAPIQQSQSMDRARMVSASFGGRGGGGAFAAKPMMAAMSSPPGGAAAIVTGWRPPSASNASRAAPPPPPAAPGAAMALNAGPPSPPMLLGHAISVDDNDDDEFESVDDDRALSSQSRNVQNIEAVLTRGERLDSLVDKTSSLSQSSLAFSKSAQKRDEGGIGSPGSLPAPAPPHTSTFRKMRKSSAAPASQPMGGFSAPIPSPTSSATEPITLESIARAQQFDGSFPYNPSWVARVCGKQAIPAMPGRLSGLTGDDNTKATVWATVLMIACLKRKFTSEKDSWEMMAEKASGWVEDTLSGMGVDGSAVCASLIATAVGLL